MTSMEQFTHVRSKIDPLLKILKNLLLQHDIVNPTYALITVCASAHLARSLEHTVTRVHKYVAYPHPFHACLCTTQKTHNQLLSCPTNLTLRTRSAVHQATITHRLFLQIWIQHQHARSTTTTEQNWQLANNITRMHSHNQKKGNLHAQQSCCDRRNVGRVALSSLVLSCSAETSAAR